MKEKFRAAYSCNSCHEFLNFHQMMYSQGVCPYCGHVSNSTIVDCTKKAVESEPLTSEIEKTIFGNNDRQSVWETFFKHLKFNKKTVWKVTLRNTLNTLVMACLTLSPVSVVVNGQPIYTISKQGQDGGTCLTLHQTLQPSAVNVTKKLKRTNPSTNKSKKPTNWRC